MVRFEARFSVAVGCCAQGSRRADCWLATFAKQREKRGWKEAAELATSEFRRKRAVRSLRGGELRREPKEAP